MNTKVVRFRFTTVLSALAVAGGLFLSPALALASSPADDPEPPPGGDPGDPPTGSIPFPYNVWAVTMTNDPNPPEIWSDPLADGDGDTRPNLNEYALATDFTRLEFLDTTNQFRFTFWPWRNTRNVSYIVERSFTRTDTWTQVALFTSATINAGSSPVSVLFDVNDADAPAYFRLRVQLD